MTSTTSGLIVVGSSPALDASNCDGQSYVDDRWWEPWETKAFVAMANVLDYAFQKGYRTRHGSAQGIR